jgi:glycine cleavage system aminomethyltransferase T
MPPVIKATYSLAYQHWRDEQRARVNTAAIFDQTYHMDDLYLTGPDRIKLLADSSINSYANFGANKAKQYVATNVQGYAIADGILFGLSEDEVLLVGLPPSSHWLQYLAKQGGYDVKLQVEPASYEGALTSKRLYRYNIEGPNAWKILKKAAGTDLQTIKFFQMGEFKIVGHTVRALNHTMGGVPGEDLTGLELFGPFAEGPAVFAAILAAGKEFGLLHGGQLAYASSVVDSGWLGFPMPAIYADDLRPYREWLKQDCFETFRPITGSFRSDSIEDYYATPWDLGYGHMIKFDHDFIGRAALEKMAKKPARTKVWLQWNYDDATRVVASSQIGGKDGGDGAKPIELPQQFGTYDQVLIGDKMVGLALYHGHSVAQGSITSLGYVNVENAASGTDVEILWGDPDGGASNPFTARHRQMKIRAKMFSQSPTGKS